MRDRDEGEPPGWGAGREKSSDPPPRFRSGGLNWKRPGSSPAAPPQVLGRDFPDRDPRAEGRARTGRRVEGEPRGLPPGAPTAGCGADRRRDPPARRPGTHHAASGSPGPSPCPTRGEGAARRGGSGALRGTRAQRRRWRPRVRAECGGGRLAGDGGGRRPGAWARDTAPPPSAGPSGPPTREPGRREGGPSRGLGSPPNPGRRRGDAPGPEIAGSLPLPPPPPPTAAGPVITQGGPAPRPARGRLPGLEVMRPGLGRPAGRPAGQCRGS